MKRAAWAGVVVVAVAVAGLAPFLLPFVGLEPVVDGAELRPGVTLVRDGMVNIALVRLEEGRVALVDCGADPQGASIMHALARAGLSADEVTAIFLTHGHRDHLGACRLFPRAVVFALAEERPLIEGETVARGPFPRFRSPAVDLAVHVGRTVRDGEELTVGGVRARAFRLPGHTGGSTAWLLSGVLFMGDSAALERGGTLRPAAWVFTDDSGENRRSLQGLPRRLLGEHVEALAFGHSGPSPDARPLMETARGHLRNEGYGRTTRKQATNSASSIPQAAALALGGAQGRQLRAQLTARLSEGEDRHVDVLLWGTVLSRQLAAIQ